MQRCAKWKVLCPNLVAEKLRSIYRPENSLGNDSGTSVGPPKTEIDPRRKSSPDEVKDRLGKEQNVFAVQFRRK